MAEQSHTPEVWKACGTIYEHMVAEVRTGEKGEGEPVAQVWEGPNGFARARLIAAAPDHHAVALELHRLSLVIESAVRTADPAYRDEVLALIKANRAAIAKATGGSA